MFHHCVKTETLLPWQNLVVSVLEVSLLVFADRINQLVLMEVEDLLQSCQIRSESHQLTQVQDRAAEQNPAETDTLRCSGPEPGLRDSTWKSRRRVTTQNQRTTLTWVKATQEVPPQSTQEVLSQSRDSLYRIGLLIHFSVTDLKECRSGVRARSHIHKPISGEPSPSAYFQSVRASGK